MTMPMTLTLARKAPRATRILGLGLLLALITLPFLALLPADHPLAISVWTLTLAGKILCYAIVAVALDLVWGYAGMLSLGHGIFFALGGYAMGMYLMPRPLAKDYRPSCHSCRGASCRGFGGGRNILSGRSCWSFWFLACWRWYSVGLPFGQKSKGSISLS